MTERGERTGGATSTGINTDTKPRALIHRKILDIASENPDASMEAIAEEVSGASITFVERVLEEYGDPAERGQAARQTEDEASGLSAAAMGPESSNGDSVASAADNDGRVDAADERRGEAASDGGRQSHPADGEAAPNLADSATGNGSRAAGDDLTVESGTATDGTTDRESVHDEPAAGDEERHADGTDDDAATVPEPSELTDKQRETLVAVAERPSATQAEIAEELGVSRATVSKRLGSLDGFEWPDRAAFVDEVFEYRGGSSTGRTVADGPPVEPSERVAALEARIEALEAQLNGGETTEPDPELVHKVVHACMDAEYVSQEEELEILREIFQHGTGWP